MKFLLENRHKLVNFVLSSVHDRDEAEEVLQRASLKVLSRSLSLRDPARAKAWIYRILRNEIVDHFRRLAVDSKRRAEVAAYPAALDSSSLDPPRTCNCAIQELMKLRPNYSDVLRATEMLGEAIVAYAGRNHLSANGATVLAHRARKSLRIRVRARCGPCADAGCFNCSCPA